MDLTDLYLLDHFVTRERWRTPLMLLAMAGVALLFFRSGLAKIVGALLLLARFVAMPITGSEWTLLGSIALIGTVALAARQREQEPKVSSQAGAEEAAEPDDARDPAPCPACHGMIPPEESRCPWCGWTYTADVS